MVSVAKRHFADEGVMLALTCGPAHSVSGKTIWTWRASSPAFQPVPGFSCQCTETCWPLRRRLWHQPQLSVRQLALERSRLGLTLAVSTMPLPLITLLTCLSQLSFAYCTRSRDLWLIYLQVSQLLLQSNFLHPNMVSYFYCPNLGPCISNSTCFCAFIAVCLWLRYITVTKLCFYKMVGRASSSYLAE